MYSEPVVTLYLLLVKNQKYQKYLLTCSSFLGIDETFIGSTAVKIALLRKDEGDNKIHVFRFEDDIQIHL
jgi:hypothetical protein